LEKIAAVIRSEGLDPHIYHAAKSQLDAIHRIFKGPNYTFMNLNDRRGPRVPVPNPMGPQRIHPFLKEFLPHGPAQRIQRRTPEPFRPSIEPLRLRKKRRPPITMQGSPLARLEKHLPKWF